MKHKSNRVLKVIKRTLFACVVLLAANLFQYFAEPTPQPPSVLENLIGTVNDVLGGARGLVNGIIRP